MVRRYAHLSAEHLQNHGLYLDDIAFTDGTNLVRRQIADKELCLQYLDYMVGPVGFEPTTKGL